MHRILTSYTVASYVWFILSEMSSFLYHSPLPFHILWEDLIGHQYLPQTFSWITLISRQYILILNLALLQYNQAPANVMDAGLNTGTRDESGFWQAHNLPRMMFYFYSLLLFIYWLLGIWDLSSLTRDQEFPCIGSIVLTTGSPGESQGWHFPESYFAFPTRQ